MSHEGPKGWINKRVRAAMRSETDTLYALVAETQAAIAELRSMVQAADDRAMHVEAGLTALREAVERNERGEALRLRVEGLSAQNRWDTDQLRQALAAIAERLPLTD